MAVGGDLAGQQLVRGSMARGRGRARHSDPGANRGGRGRAINHGDWRSAHYSRDGSWGVSRSNDAVIDAFIASLRYRSPSQQLLASAHQHQIDQLDGRGLATLMKHMAASGLSSEAWELFEFFKEQQGSHCDVFVYTVSSRILYQRP